MRDVSNNLSIRQLVYILLACLLVPSSLLVARSIYGHYQQDLRANQEAALSLADLVSARAESLLNEGRHVLFTLRDRPLVRALDPKRCDPILRDILQFHRAFSNLSTIDPSGQAICSSVRPPGQELPNYGERGWFSIAVASPSLAIGAPIMGRTSKRWAMPLALPLQGSDGELTGFLSLTINLHRVDIDFAHAAYPAGTEVVIVNPAGTYIANSSRAAPSEWLGQRLQDPTLLQIALDSANFRAAVRHRSERNGEELIVAIVPVPGTDWRVIATAPTRGIAAIARADALSSLLAIAMLLAAALTATVFVTRWIERPIRSMAAAALAQTQGDTSARAAESGTQELILVAQQFNRMLDARDLAGEALRQSRERYELVEQSANVGIWDRNLLTDECFRSPRWQTMLGYSDGEIANTAMACIDLLHPDDRTIFVRKMEAFIAADSRGLLSLDCRIRHKDGDYRWVNSRAAIIRDAADRPVRLIGTMFDITDRKQAEELLTESRADLARAEMIAGLAHYKVDLIAGRVSWSDNLYRILGKSPETLTPTVDTAPQLVHPDDRHLLAEHRRAMSTEGKPRRLELRWLRDNGQLVFTESISIPNFDANGSITGWFGTLQDISERKKAEDALRQSQERFHLIEAAGGLGVWDRNLVTGECHYSPGWKSILGYANDELPNSPTIPEDLAHPEDRDRLLAHRRACLESDTSAYHSIDFRLRHKDGHYRWVHGCGVVIRDAARKPLRFLGTTTDITERKRAEAAIAESRDNLARAEIMGRIGHYRVDLQTGTITWSDNLYRLLGKSPDYFAPSLDTVSALIHPDDRPLLEAHRLAMIAGTASDRLVMRWIREDGSIIHAAVLSSPIRDDEGNVTGWFGTLQDITLHKQAEDVLARANEELGRRVAEHTAELACELQRREDAQSKLAQIQKLDAIGQLTAGIAHDFNNLLAVIKGALEFIENDTRRGLPADPELVETSLRATRRGKALVSRLLAFASRAPLKAEPANIDQLVLDTLRFLQRTLGEGVDIVTSLNAQSAAVKLDRNQFANALMNLALNARQAMPEGGQLTVATCCQPAVRAADDGQGRWPTGEEVCISVTDTGVGMSKEICRRAFEPFFTTKPDSLGTGLGLSMVHGFVQQTGGHIEIDSIPGQGTTVTIRLPCIAAAAAADDDEASSTAHGAPKPRERSVLLVEDDPDLRVVTAAQLKSLGYRVTAVGDGNEAVDLIESPATIDLVMTDIVLPGGIDGVMLLKDAMRSRPRLGVLCMSGYNPSQAHSRWLKVQNIELLEKPFSSARLARALESALVTDQR